MKKAIITGASSGLGYCLAQQLIIRIPVIALCRRTPSIEGIIHIPCDLTDTEGIELAAKQIIEQHSDADVLINNAGVFASGDPSCMDSDIVDGIMAVNLSGLIKLTNALLEQLVTNTGDIINISSVAGLQASADHEVYAASKWGVRGYTQALQDRFKKHPLRIMGIYPGGINTPLFEQGGDRRDTSSFMDPDQVATQIISALDAPRGLQISHMTINRKWTS